MVCNLLDLLTPHKPDAALMGKEGEAPMGQHLTKFGVRDTEDVGGLPDRNPVRIGVSEMGAPRVAFEGDALHLARSHDVAAQESSSALKAAP